MRKLMLVVGALGAVLLNLGAATAREGTLPDFSGTWILQEAHGDLPERAVKALTKGARQPITLVIAQSADTFRVTRETEKSPLTLAFSLDGTETSQPAPYGELTSRTRWEGNSLVTTGSRPLPGPFPIGTRVVPFTETRTLSEDRNQMTIEIQFKTPRGIKTRTATFRRAG